MRIPDLINGLFELLGAVTIWVNVRRLYRDKEIKGVYWPVWIVYALWGFWNLYYYPVLGQWISFVCGAGVVVGNSTWVFLAIHYTRKNRPPVEVHIAYQPMPSVEEICPHVNFDDQLICTGCGGCALDLAEARRLSTQPSPTT